MSQMNRWMLAAIPAMMMSVYVQAAPAWTEGATYTAGTTVTYKGVDYTALVTHTAHVGAGWTPDTTATLWKAGAASTATTAPTVKPTTAPTTKPTVKPTTAPTAKPTVAPTPTAAPSAVPTAPAGLCAATWNSATAYQGGQRVVYNNTNYEAKWWVQGTAPSSTDEWGPWKNLGACNVKPTATPSIKPTTTPVVTIAPTPTATTKPTTTPTATAKPTATATATAKPTATPVVTITPTATAKPTATPVVAAYKPQITYVAAPAGYPTDAQFTADEQALYSQTGTDTGAIARIRTAIRTLDNSKVDAVTVGNVNNPDNVKRVERILNEAKFNQLFPVRHISYTYLNLLKGVAKFPAYCDNYTDGRDADMICRKLLATSFAHFVQETGANWPSLTPADVASYPDRKNPVLATMDQKAIIPMHKQSLWNLRELNHVEGDTGSDYKKCTVDTELWGIFYPCAQNAQGQYLNYFGHGAKQLSWNYNYGPFSKSIYGDVNVLLDNQGLVADTWLNFASAIWFAVYPQSPKPPMTWVIDGTWKPNAVDLAAGMKPGFGATTYIINGGMECGKGSEVSTSLNRIAAFKAFTQELGVTVGADEPMECGNMKGFTAGSAASTKTYLDRAWNYNANNPGGVSWSCQLAEYQTPFSLVNAGDYKTCVDYYFRGQVKLNGQVVINNAK